MRDKTGHEVDCIIEQKGRLIPLEIKSGKTINQRFFEGLTFWNTLSNHNPEDGVLVYAGDESMQRSLGKVVSWRDIENAV